jgi:hypothetical protein
MPRDKSKDAAAKAVRRQNPEFREKENRARAEKVPLERLAGRILGKKPAARAESRFDLVARLIAEQEVSAEEEKTGILAQPTRDGVPLNENVTHLAGGMIQISPRPASHPAFMASKAGAEATKPKDALGLGIYGKSGVLFRSWYEQPAEVCPECEKNFRRTEGAADSARPRRAVNPIVSRVVEQIETNAAPDWCFSALAGIAGSAVIDVWELLRDAQEDGADSLLDTRPMSLPVKVSREGDKVWFEFDPLQLQIGKTFRDDEDLLNLAAESRASEQHTLIAAFRGPCVRCLPWTVPTARRSLLLGWRESIDFTIRSRLFSGSPTA